MSPQAKYKPALAYDSLTRLYDPVMKLTMRETTFKTALVRQANLEADHHVLDLGCGTATLTALIKLMHPAVRVTGLDGDVKALELARQKLAERAGDVDLVRGMSFAMPLADRSFDRVLSSLLFHHLSTADKLRTLRDCWRVLKPGGEIHIADWGRPGNLLLRGAFYAVQLLDGFDTTTDNVRGLLPEFIKEAGFEQVRETGQFATVFGAVSLYCGVKPDQP